MHRLSRPPALTHGTGRPARAAPRKSRNTWRTRPEPEPARPVPEREAADPAPAVMAAPATTEEVALAAPAARTAVVEAVPASSAEEAAEKADGPMAHVPSADGGRRRAAPRASCR